MSTPTRWRVERGGFRPRGNRWEPFAAGSTNRLWRSRGSSGEWLLKWYKHPLPGVHPEPEVGRFLQQRGFEGVPEFGGRLDRREPGGWTTVAYIQRWIPGRSAWDFLLDALRGGSVSLRWACDLGRRIGGLHAILATGEEVSDPAFGVKEYDAARHQQWIGRLHAGAERLRAALQAPPPQGMAASVWEQTHAVWLADETRWRERIRSMQSLEARGSCSRIHGDLHLGQILQAENRGPAEDWWVVDFEGEPLRPLQQRRALDLPLRDVAGMWRSFAYAAAVAGLPAVAAVPLREAFLDGWAERMPVPEGDWRCLLEALVWEKSIYEALYEIEHRPDWLWVPLRSLS